MLSALPLLLLVLTPISTVSSAALPSQTDDSYTTYDENFVFQMYQMCAASYAGGDSNGDNVRDQCFQKAFGPNTDMSTLALYQTKCDGSSTLCQMFVARSVVDNIMLFAFRGTQGARQLLDEFGSWVAQEAPACTYGPNGVYSCGYTNHYFTTAAENFWADRVVNHLNLTDANTTFYVTGHSLGGAMAALTAFRLATRANIDPHKIQLVTFGQPRTGDVNFARALSSVLPNVFRVVHSHDPIPHVPPMDNSTSGRGAYHHIREVWYPSESAMLRNENAYKLCSIVDGEDEKCSDQFNGPLAYDKVSQHLTYFNLAINKYGPSGCTKAASVPVSASLVFVLGPVIATVLHRLLRLQ